MTNQSPPNLSIPELLNTNLTGVGTVRLVIDVLGGDADSVIGQFTGQQEVDGGRGDDDLGLRVELGVVEVVDDGFGALDGTVPGQWLVLVGFWGECRAGKMDVWMYGCGAFGGSC